MASCQGRYSVFTCPLSTKRETQFGSDSLATLEPGVQLFEILSLYSLISSPIVASFGNIFLGIKLQAGSSDLDVFHSASILSHPTRGHAL